MRHLVSIKEISNRIRGTSYQGFEDINPTGEPTMTPEEHQKMKQELESEYLALFKKTVSLDILFLIMDII